MGLPNSELSRAVLVGTSTYAKTSGFPTLPSVARNLEGFATLLSEQTGLRHVKTVLDPDDDAEILGALKPAVDAAEALALAQEIASKNPDAIRASKRLSALARKADARTVLEAESSEQTALIGSPNQVEAIRANMEKRAPVFTDAKPVAVAAE